MSHTFNSGIVHPISSFVFSGTNDFHHSVVLNGCSSDTKYSHPLILHIFLSHNICLSNHNTVFIDPFDHNTFSQSSTSSIFFFVPSAIVTCVHATKHDVGVGLSLLCTRYPFA
jgi:hypothetical protein